MIYSQLTGRKHRNDQQRYNLITCWLPKERCLRYRSSLLPVNRKNTDSKPLRNKAINLGIKGQSLLAPSLRRAPGERALSGGHITIERTGQRLGQLPLVPVRMVAVESAIIIPLGIFEATPGSHLVGPSFRTRSAQVSSHQIPGSNHRNHRGHTKGVPNLGGSQCKKLLCFILLFQFI